MPKTDPAEYAATKYRTTSAKARKLDITDFSDFAPLRDSLCVALSLLTGEEHLSLQDCKRVVVFFDGNVRRFNKNSLLQDEVVERAGLNNLLPFLFSAPQNQPCSQFGCREPENGFGVMKLKAGETGKNYAVISTVREDQPRAYIVILNEDVNAVLSHFESQNEKNDSLLLVDRPPILDNDFMNEILKNSVEFLENHHNFAHFGTRPARGLIFRGDPGNGKTMLCKWIQVLAKKAGLTVKSYSGSDIDCYYRDGEMTYMMNSANIMFFDDIDISFLTRRKGAESDSKKACALLSAMDGISDVKKGVVRIFTTNERTTDIDPAFLRPGRIDKAFNFEPPSGALRMLVIKTYWHPDILKEIDVDALVEQTENISFADLEEIKTLLVQGYIFNKKWDMEEAINDFRHRKDTSKDPKEELEPLN